MYASVDTYLLHAVQQELLVSLVIAERKAQFRTGAASFADVLMVLASSYLQCVA